MYRVRHLPPKSNYLVLFNVHCRYPKVTLDIRSTKLSPKSTKTFSRVIHQAALGPRITVLSYSEIGSLCPNIGNIIKLIMFSLFRRFSGRKCDSWIWVTEFLCQAKCDWVFHQEFLSSSRFILLGFHVGQNVIVVLQQEFLRLAMEPFLCSIDGTRCLLAC